MTNTKLYWFDPFDIFYKTFSKFSLDIGITNAKI